MAGYARAITANTEMGSASASAPTRAERRLSLVEGVRDAFVRHAATDVAEHAAMRDFIDRLTRSSEALSAHIGRLAPAAVSAKPSARRGAPD